MTWRAGSLVLFAVLGPACRPGGSTSTDAGATTAFPSPRIGGTADTDAVANAPARCTQPAHAWLRSDELGTITARSEVTHYSGDYLAGLAATAGLTLPRAPIYDAKAQTITYRTQDRGSLVDATALLAWPYGLELDAAPVPIVLLLHGTQGFMDGCSLDRSPDTRVLVSYFASLGYVVVGPDYLGLKASGPPTGFPHPYLVGQATAIASLDAVRAAGRMPADERDGVLAAPRVLFLGGSQGGHAALWVDRLAPYYAAELELLGGVATVPPADLLAESVRALAANVDATKNVMALMAAAAPWYGAGNRLAEVFKPPFDVDIPAAMAASCSPSLDSQGGPAEVFQQAIRDAAAAGTLAEFDPPFGCIAAENGLSTTSIARRNPASPSYGILYVTGGQDPLVTTPLERVAFESLCRGGMPAQYLECEGAGHVQATKWSLTELVAFLEARAAREPFTPACTAGAAVRCHDTPDTPDGG